MLGEGAGAGRNLSFKKKGRQKLPAADKSFDCLHKAGLLRGRQTEGGRRQEDLGKHKVAIFPALDKEADFPVTHFRRRQQRITRSNTT